MFVNDIIYNVDESEFPKRGVFTMSINVDELINKGRDITDIACQKSLEMIERTKIQFKIQDSKLQARQSYIELGKIAYDLIKSGDINADSRMKLLESDIDRANYRIKLLMRELCSIKGAKVCPKCGTLNPEKAKYCSECAASLKEE